MWRLVLVFASLPRLTFFFLLLLLLFRFFGSAVRLVEELFYHLCFPDTITTVLTLCVGSFRISYLSFAGNTFSST